MLHGIYADFFFFPKFMFQPNAEPNSDPSMSLLHELGKKKKKKFFPLFSLPTCKTEITV